MNDPMSLSALQRWFQALMTHPLGVEAAMRDEANRVPHDPSDFAKGDAIDGVLTRSSRQTAQERLRVYAQAYFARLVECLQNEFPAFHHAVGEEAFAGFALEFLQQYPSDSDTLGDLGARFPQFLRETRPAAPASEDARSWSEFLIDLATLERHYAEVFDGPGDEGRPMVASEELEAIPVERWGDVRLAAAASLRVVSFMFPVHEFATAVRKGQDPALPQARPIWLAIYRDQYIVRRLPLQPAQSILLRRLIEGATLSEAIARVAQEAPEAMESLAERLSDWFSEWTQHGFFRSATLTNGD